jgi:hypothetical protein
MLSSQRERPEPQTPMRTAAFENHERRVMFCPVNAIIRMQTMKQLIRQFVPEYPAFLPFTLR